MGVRVSFSSQQIKVYAEIAQLVEHNLAKVRVASSSLVFRSNFFEFLNESLAQVAELVDAHVSGACVERHAGSSPVLGTSAAVMSREFNSSYLCNDLKVFLLRK